MTNEGNHFIPDKFGLQIKRGLEINERADVFVFLESQLLPISGDYNRCSVESFFPSV